MLHISFHFTSSKLKSPTNSIPFINAFELQTEHSATVISQKFTQPKKVRFGPMMHQNRFYRGTPILAKLPSLLWRKQSK